MRVSSPLWFILLDLHLPGPHLSSKPCSLLPHPCSQEPPEGSFKGRASSFLYLLYLHIFIWGLTAQSPLLPGRLVHLPFLIIPTHASSNVLLVTSPAFACPPSTSIFLWGATSLLLPIHTDLTPTLAPKADTLYPWGHRDSQGKQPKLL